MGHDDTPKGSINDGCAPNHKRIWAVKANKVDADLDFSPCRLVQQAGGRNAFCTRIKEMPPQAIEGVASVHNVLHNDDVTPLAADLRCPILQRVHRVIHGQQVATGQLRAATRSTECQEQQGAF